MIEENLVIPKIFGETVSKFPDKVALEIKKDNLWQRVTYKELEAHCLQVAAFLVKEGLKKPDKVALILENQPEWGIIYLGIVQAGLSCVPLDPQLSVQELENLINDSGAKIIFCSYNVFRKRSRRDSLAKFVVLDAGEAETENFLRFSDIKRIPPDKSILPSVLPEDVASLIYTSGTTALPKGVLLTHKNFCANFKSIEKLNLCFSNDNFLSILPLHHAYAFTVTLLTPLLLGATVTYCLSFRPQEILQIIKETKITILVGVPQLFSLLHKAILDRIKKIPVFLRPIFLPFIKITLKRNLGGCFRFAVSGGARLEPKIGQDLLKLGLKLIEGYGLTETAPIVTLNPLRKIKFGSVGKALPGVEIRINNPDKSGVGEVLIKGENLMQGYFKQPDLTAQAIKESWFYSGDLGYVDKEGYLFLTGREKDVIVLSSGKNIYPEELEEYFCASPYIKEICILPKREKRFGHLIEALYAIVVADLEYFRAMNEVDIRGKIRWELENLSRDLPTYKHIMGFTVTKEELPRTPLKKIKRYLVREKYLEEKLQEVRIQEEVFSEENQKLLSLDIAKKITTYISRELKKPVYLDSHLEIDLGIDSLTRVELGLGLEALLKIEIPDDFLYSASTVKEVIIKIQDLMEKPSLKKPIIKEVQKEWSQILRELPPEAILKKIRVEATFLDKLFTLIAKVIFLFIFRIFWRLKIQGKENLPKEGPFIICPNHASYLDGFVIFSSLPLKGTLGTFFIGYSAIFERPIVRWAIKAGRLIPIDPNVNLTEAMQSVSYVLAQKKIACIFPEGKRSIDESVDEFKKGAGILIKELDIPAIPVYIKGSHQSWPRGNRFPQFHPLKVIFGKPLSAEELIKREKSIPDKYEAIAKALRQEVLNLVC